MVNFKSSKDIKPSDIFETAIVFDVETVPQDPLSVIQQAEFEKRFKKSKDFLSAAPEDIPNLERKFLSVSPFFGKIICICVYFPESRTTRKLIGDEKSILTGFWDIIDQNKFSGLFISFNGLGFDVPFILRRSMILGIRPTHQRFCDTYKYQKIPHRDVYLMISEYDRGFTASLDLACDVCGVESPKHGVVKAENVEEYYKQGKIDLIADYCMKDVMATYEIYKLARYYCC